MKKDELLDALNDISGDYIRSAEERLADSAAVRPKRPLRRALTAFAAAAALALTTFTVALAASPELREAVLIFFHITEREKVPEPGRLEDGSRGPEVSGSEIGGAVKAVYVRLGEGRFLRRGDLLYKLEADEAAHTLRPVEYWSLSAGGISREDIHPDRRYVSVTWRGETFETCFDWFAREGEIVVDTVSGAGESWDGDTDPRVDVSAIPGHTDKLLLTLHTQTDGGVWYMLYDLETGRTADFLADTGAAALAPEKRLTDAVWSSGMTAAVLTVDQGEEKTKWYLDVDSGALTELSALTGVKASGAFFADDRTLLLYSWDEPFESPGTGTVTFWAYDLDGGILRQTLERTTCLNDSEHAFPPHGVIAGFGNGQKWCVLVEEDGSARLRDLKDGREIPIENFTFARGGDILPSPDGSRLLYYVRDLEQKPVIQWAELGVIDIGKGVFVAFDRDVPATSQEGIFWLDDTCVGVESSAVEESGLSGPGGYYLYDFSAEK